MKAARKQQVTIRNVDELAPYANNPRTHSEDQIAKVARSIAEFGFTNPILVDARGTVIAGHARLEAAKSLGLDTVPTIELSHLSPTQIRAYVIADNQLALDAGWDEDLLALELDGLRLEGFELALTGLSDLDIDRLLDQANTSEDPPAPDPPDEPVTVPGDLWCLGQHRLLCGDSCRASDVARLLNGVVPGLMVTDPPYGVDYDPAWRERELGPGKRATGQVSGDSCADWTSAWKLFEGDVAYVWHAGNHAHEVGHHLAKAGFEIRAQVIWRKTRFVISRGHYHGQHEPCWYAVRKGKPASWSGDRKQSTVWDIEHLKSDTGHGTQKPLECMARPIRNHTNMGQCVYDPFVGSGTTIIAAENLGRVCLAADIDPAYVDVAVMRWQELSGGQAVLEGQGKTFDEVALKRKAA